MSKHSRGIWGGSREAAIGTRAYQYTDSATHYRAYLVLHHKKFPKIDDIWVSLCNSIFSPRLFTTTEKEKGLSYTANLSEMMGKICVVEVSQDFGNHLS